MQTLLGLVEAKMGVSIVPASVVAHTEGVRFVRLMDPSPEAPAQMPLYMVWPDDGPNPPRDAFIAAVRERMPLRAADASTRPQAQVAMAGPRF